MDSTTYERPSEVLLKHERFGGSIQIKHLALR